MRLTSCSHPCDVTLLEIWHHLHILMMSHSHPCDNFSCSHLSQHSFYHSGHSHPYTPTKSCTLAPLPKPTPCTPTHATSTLGHVGLTSIPPHHMPHGTTSSICHIDATLVPYHVMPSDKSKAMSSCATMNIHTPTVQLFDLVQNELASNFGHEQCTSKN
jgi:hypothetical protein